MSHATTPITAPRRYPSAPLVGVGVAIYDDEGQVLLVQRGRPPRIGTWGLPGGLIDLGESLQAAAAREVKEELGIDVAVQTMVTTFESIHHDDAGKIEYHYVVLEYWARYQGGEPVAQDDAAACAWVTAGQLDAYALTSSQRRVLDQTYAAWLAATPAHSQTRPSQRAGQDAQASMSEPA
jgi:mutator protein MutT